MTGTTQSGGNIGFFGVLFFIFLALKLTDRIDWSWWWVTAPLWGPLLVAVPCVVFLVMANRAGRS